MVGNKVLRHIFRRHFGSRLNEMVAPNYAVVLDYPMKALPRYGYGKPPHPEIAKILERESREYARRLSGFCALKDHLTKIAYELPSDAVEPCWMPHRFFSSLDAVALYGMLVEFRPKRMIEVGSGDSTKFARRAIRDQGLPTHLTSIDPQPRASIDQLCDCVIRQPLEDVDAGLFEQLQSGDFMFIDSSHRTFTNSDVTVLFMNLLPRLGDGVVVHLHDIFWPFDYPPEWNDRYYSEQYLLGVHLLSSGNATPKVLLPNAFIVHDLALLESCRTLLNIPGIRCPVSATWPCGIGGSSFWMQTSQGSTGPA